MVGCYGAFAVAFFLVGRHAVHNFPDSPFPVSSFLIIWPSRAEHLIPDWFTSYTIFCILYLWDLKSLFSCFFVFPPLHRPLC